MKTAEQVAWQLDTIRNALHIHRDDMADYFIGQMTALLWVTGGFDSWTAAHIAADNLWEASRKERKAQES